MSNEVQQSNDLLEVVKQSAFNISAIGQQLGLIVPIVQKLDTKVNEIEGRMHHYEDSLRITRSQGKQIKRAVIARVSELLGIVFEGGRVADESIEVDRRYRGGFISRCYVDAKRNGVMAECYWETPRGDYEKCMEYIEAWYPEVKGGVEGYKEYLDIRRQEREAKKDEKRARR